jgi:hypothetical protein
MIMRERGKRLVRDVALTPVQASRPAQNWLEQSKRPEQTLGGKRKGMGRFYGGKRQEMGFPDEFGVDMCQTEQDQPITAAEPNPGPPLPCCGYLTLEWFGPYLLSPLSRRERGSC